MIESNVSFQKKKKPTDLGYFTEIILIIINNYINERSVK